MANRRDEILEAAYNLMGRAGLEEVHARTVAAELGINHATVHYYFAKRPDLLVGIAEFAREQLQRDRQKLNGDAAGPSDIMDNELALAEAYARSQSRFGKVMVGLCAASVSTPELKKPVEALWKEWSDLHAKIVPDLKLKKRSPFQDPMLLSSSLFGVVAAAHVSEKALSPAEHLDRIYASMFGE